MIVQAEILKFVIWIFDIWILFPNFAHLHQELNYQETKH